MMHDTPAARSFTSYLAGAQEETAWIKRAQLTEPKIVRFTAGDAMPPALVTDPGRLDSILRSLTRVAHSAR